MSSSALVSSEFPVLPIARVRGEQLTELPQDLYIPPDALRILLETFEGPLDLLLYLIKKQNLDILDIPIAEISKQYMHYIELMQDIQLALAGEYLVMAAMLAEIKSRLLLPRPAAMSEQEEDPRAELVRRLQEYERFQQAAQHLDELARLEREHFVVDVALPEFDSRPWLPQVSTTDLLNALQNIMQRASLSTQHRITHDVLSVRERMNDVLTRLSTEHFTEFHHLFNVHEGRLGVVVTLLAVLELVRQTAIELAQAQPFAPIYVRAKG